MSTLEIAIAIAAGAVSVAAAAIFGTLRLRRGADDAYRALVEWTEGRRAEAPDVGALPGGLALVRELERLDEREASWGDEEVAAERDVGDARALRSRLVAHVTHDLRSPMNAILGFADALLGDPFASLSPEQRQNVREIRSAAVELERLIGLILDTARLEAGRLPLVAEPVAPVELVTRTLEQLADREAATRVEVALTPGLPTAWVDRPRLVRALAALVAHGLHAGQRARFSARLEFEAKEPFVVLSLVVSTGVDPSRYARLVDGTAGLGSGTRPRLASAAIALSFARGLLRMGGGRLEISADSTDEPLFRFRLPARSPAP